MKEASMYEKYSDGRVRCTLCHHRCIVPVGGVGRCTVRGNRNGRLFSLNYGKAISVAVDPVEKKPLAQFMPGTRTYSLAAQGCNMRCAWCQNWEISQPPAMSEQPSGLGRTAVERAFAAIRGVEISPEEHVQAALDTSCQSLSYTYSEPTIFFEYALDTMKLAGGSGLANIWVTNGFMTPEALDMLCPHLQAANVDLKAFDARVYREYCNGDLEPVLRNLKRLHEAGVHLEITTLIVTGVNDDERQLRGMAEFIAGELDPSVPWHVSRFFPAWRLGDRPPTSVETIRKAMEWGREAGLSNIHPGNVVL